MNAEMRSVMPTAKSRSRFRIVVSPGARANLFTPVLKATTWRPSISPDSIVNVVARSPMTGATGTTCELSPEDAGGGAAESASVGLPAADSLLVVADAVAGCATPG